MENGSRKMLIAATAPAMVLPLLAALCYFVWFSSQPAARTIYFGTKIFTLLWPLLAWRLLARRISADMLSLRGSLESLPLALLSGAAISAALFALMRTPLAAMVEEAVPAIRAKAQQLGFLAHYWSFAIFLSLIHSLLEEYYWRWFVYGRLRELLPPAVALALAALAFGAHHVVVLSQYFTLGWAFGLGLMVALGGALWCLMYRYQQNIVGAWISHMVVDLAVMWLGYRLLFQGPFE
jgi:uncharacterized protein